MKTLYDIYESIFDNDTEKKLDDLVLVNNLYAEDEIVREKAILTFKEKVEKYNPRRHKSTNTIKNSDGYVVEFGDSWLESSGRSGINYMIVTTRIGSNWWTVMCNSNVDKWTPKPVNHWTDSWNNTRSNLNPKQFIYDVPEDLVPLFKSLIHKEYGLDK